MMIHPARCKVPWQPAMAAPVRVEAAYPAGEDGGEGLYCQVSWVLNTAKFDPVEASP